MTIVNDNRGQDPRGGCLLIALMGFALFLLFLAVFAYMGTMP